MNDIRLPLPKLGARHRELYEILKGVRSDDGFPKSSGMLLGEQSALLQVGQQSGYFVGLAVGSNLYLVGGVRAANPMIRDIKGQITFVGNT